MTTITLLSQATDLNADDYCVFGLATCFLRQDGEIEQVKVCEPIPSAALEAIVKGIPTSYELACAKTLGEIFQGETVKIPSEFPAEARLSDRFEERVIAATRTYKVRPEAKEHISLGSIKQDFNFSLERKRVLNSVNVVSREDNVKQHSHTHKVL